VDQNHPEGSPFFYKKNSTLSNLAENSICPSHLQGSFMQTPSSFAEIPRGLPKLQIPLKFYQY
jgi:hypothetical protein